MKRYLIPLSVVLVLASCGIGEDVSPKDSTSLKKQDACSAVSNADIAQLMNINASEVQSKEQGSSDSYSACYYFSSEVDDKVLVRLGWSNENAIKNKVPEQIFTQFLEEGEGNITYREVSNNGTIQIISGLSGITARQYTHIVRKRFGNVADAQLELLNYSDDNSIENTLLEILNKIK